jgi:DNA polymerase V
MDVTHYLNTYGLTARQFAMKIILDVLDTTGITATAGIGANLYLCKIAMDIGAKHIQPDQNGVRIAELDEMSYRKSLWSHRPLTDFWRVGKGYAKKLEEHGLYTMGDIARCSIGGPADHRNEALLYKLFGVNAELLIDHAWGWEPVTIADVKAYKPSTNSISSGQVLQSPYPCNKAKLIVREMTDLLALDLVDKGLVANQLVLTIGYDIENLTDPKRRQAYRGEVTTDHYGRAIPKHAHGTANLGRYTSSTKLILDAVSDLFERIIDEKLLVRRINVTAAHVIEETAARIRNPTSSSTYLPIIMHSRQSRPRKKRSLRRKSRGRRRCSLSKSGTGKTQFLKA